MRCSTCLILVLFSLSAPATAIAQTSPSAPAPGTPVPAPYLDAGPRDMFAKGVALIDRGAVQEAKTVFKALTLAYPELPEPHINLAVLLAAEDDFEGSAAEAEAAIMAHPICRAAFDLEFQRQIGPYSTAVLGSTQTPTPRPPARSSASPSDTVAAPPRRVISQAADPCLNFRPEPKAAATALDCLSPGTPVRLLETAGGWSRVALRDGREGWMASAFLERTEP